VQYNGGVLRFPPPRLPGHPARRTRWPDVDLDEPTNVFSERAALRVMTVVVDAEVLVDLEHDPAAPITLLAGLLTHP
jgi:hypothetical protein